MNVDSPPRPHKSSKITTTIIVDPSLIIFMFNTSLQCSTQQSKWFLILDWPGLDKIHPFRITRSISGNTILAQFRDHALPCSSSMDKVLYDLKNRRLGYDTDYDFLLQTM
jgi:hypothetical protein